MKLQEKPAAAVVAAVSTPVAILAVVVAVVAVLVVVVVEMLAEQPVEQLVVGAMGAEMLATAVFARAVRGLAAVAAPADKSTVIEAAVGVASNDRSFEARLVV